MSFNQINRDENEGEIVLALDWNQIISAELPTNDIQHESISDGLVRCLTTFGRVDIEYISSITGKSCIEVIDTLRGSIYQNPETWEGNIYCGWELAGEYLSGNLKRKWNSAQEANTKYNGYFEDNIRAIEKIIPKSAASKDIYVNLGSPWVPADVIDDFITYLFGKAFSIYGVGYKTIHDELTGTWEIPHKTRYSHSVSVCHTYGIPKLEALYILENTLNMKPIQVTDEVPSRTNKSGKKRVINKVETLAALEKQQLIIKTFKEWIWKNPKRKARLTSIFEEKYGCVMRRNFDGSFLDFPTMSPSVELYPYQKNAIARIIFSNNTLLAHDVGSGKTFVMIAAGQEMKRMGISRKNMYVVPNNIIGQWRDIFYNMYPSSKLLCVEAGNFTPGKRYDTLIKMRDEDYDGIIITYSCFEQIPLSKGFYIDELKNKKRQIDELVNRKGWITTRLRKKKEELEKEIGELSVKSEDNIDTIYFDELGITRLFVDEAHNFKNVPIETKTGGVLGISRTGSKKCKDMMEKVHLVQRNNNGKGVVFATGTPITNSITDIFVIQQYLQSGELAMLDLQSFDGWIGMFAEKNTEFEVDVDTNSYRLATRFSKFHNLPELTALLASIADFHQMDNKNGIPDCDGYVDTLVGKSEELADFLKVISLRADAVRNGRCSREEDNMLKITISGRLAALDIRLVMKNISYSLQSKVAYCVEKASDIYFKTKEQKSTQIIFCDSSTPKPNFNIYDELKLHLIEEGVAEEDIAYIHDATTEAKRTALFEKVRRGEIRILIGSTLKLGLGVNVQDRLIAIHHIDVPWRPADMVQREGRILRQGNTNEKIFIYRYITEGSFDAYSWQLLESKQHFISEILSGSLTERSGSDIDDTVLNYAEVKALAIGNPLIKERVELANELTRVRTLQHKFIENTLSMEKAIIEFPGKIAHQKSLISKCINDMEFYKNFMLINPPAEDVQGKKAEAERRKEIRENIHEFLKDNISKADEHTVMEYKGFRIVLPANMHKEKPYIWLVREGKYYVELGNTAKGNLVRIDNFLDSFDKYLENLNNKLLKYIDNEKAMKEELKKEDGYADLIQYYQKKIATIDKKLGVKNA